MTPSEQKTAELFYKAVLAIKNEQECADFFDDVCTSKELLAIAQRFMVAKMLKERRVYSEIVKETGASTATVSRVKRMMSDGTGAVNEILDRTRK
ncbi:MAG: YerC/YecD family TrpR-related protein [Acutalibacteraceae bacterium]|nr:YerC/YecD family TrpR-related protein [Acutalibacteraceae bacterium]